MNLQDDKFDHSGSWRGIVYRLVELPKIPSSVVGCKDLQEGKMHSVGWRGKGLKLVEIVDVAGSMERAAKWLMVILASPSI